jgi:sugar phosphate isomerase/epimerase
MFLPIAYSPAAIQSLAALKESLGISYTVHLPLWSVEPSSPLQPVREGSTEALIASIEVTRPLEPEVYVLHATGALAAEFYRMRLPETARNVILQQFRANARRSLIEILDHTGIASRLLAIETIEFPFELTISLAEELDLSICLDTGHVLVGFSGEVNLFEALQRCAPRLAEIHLHDGPDYALTHQIGYGKDHQAIGKGDLEITRFLNELKNLNFQGPIIFELTLPEAVLSLQAIQKLQPDRSSGDF